MKKQRGVWSIFIVVDKVVAWFSSENGLRNGMKCLAPETEQRCRNAASSQRTTHEATQWGGADIRHFGNHNLKKALK